MVSLRSMDIYVLDESVDPSKLILRSDLLEQCVDLLAYVHPHHLPSDFIIYQYMEGMKMAGADFPKSGNRTRNRLLLLQTCYTICKLTRTNHSF